MNTSKIYYDLEGNEKTILQMVKDEPLWAANRVQEGEGFEAENTHLKAKIESLDIVLAVAINENKSVWSENSILKAKLANYVEGLKKGQNLFDTIICLIVEGIEFMTSSEVLKSVESEAKNGYHLIDNLLTKGVD